MDEEPLTDLTGQEAPEKEEFHICTELSDFPVSDCPAFLREGVGGVCISGHITIQVLDNKFRIVPNTVFTLLPWQLAFIKEVSEDFRMTFFRISQTMFIDTLSGLWRLRPGFFFYMSRHLVSGSDEGYIRRFLSYCDLMEYWNKHSPANCRRETVMQFLRLYYWILYAAYINDPMAEVTRYTHKEELAFRFMHYIIEEHSPDKDVTYYARKLGLSAKSLTNLIRSISGQSARDWIVFYTIFEIKTLLRDSSLDIKAICRAYAFSRPCDAEPLLSPLYRHDPYEVPREFLFLIFIFSCFLTGFPYCLTILAIIALVISV